MAYRVARFTLLALIVGCASPPPAPAPLTAEKPAFAETEDEQKVLRVAAQQDRDLYRKGLVLDDELVVGYVGRVGQSLVPPAAARLVEFHFRVLREPVVNAFSLPNGSIYINVGLLARLENEAQLAHVLGHEIAHTVKRHSLDRRRAYSAARTATNIASIATFGSSVAEAPALQSLAQHSREQENEADALGLQYVSAAGYPLSEAEKVFRIIQVTRPRDSVAGSPYASHPDTRLRAAEARKIIETGGLAPNSDASVGASEYLAVRREVISENIRLQLNVRKYQLAADCAGDALADSPSSAWLHYYRGEALRLMAEDAEGAARERAWLDGISPTKQLVAEFRTRRPALLAAAKQSFARSLSLEADFPEGHRGLGLTALAQGNTVEASAELRRYLREGKDIKDRRYVENLLAKMEKR